MKDRIITLTNGVRVANFSSPHAFTFIDGTVLPAVDKELSQKLSLAVKEVVVKNPQRFWEDKFDNIIIDFFLDSNCIAVINEWNKAYLNEDVDVVLVPLPLMTALHKVWDDNQILNSPFRTIRVANRQTKEIHIDKFCI